MKWKTYSEEPQYVQCNELASADTSLHTDWTTETGDKNDTKKPITDDNQIYIVSRDTVRTSKHDAGLRDTNKRSNDGNASMESSSGGAPDDEAPLNGFLSNKE